MSDTPRIRYTPRPDTTPETELNALAAVYRFILDYHTKHKTVEPAPEPDGRDTRRSESMVAPDDGVLRGGGTSVEAVVRMRGR
jgi:hypothetical protein